MANTVLTASIIAAEALKILENQIVMGSLVYRGYEDDFDQKVNGYSVGATINVRRPTDYTVRDGRTATIQNVTEGQFPLTVDKQKGIDFQFTTSDLALNITQLSDRAIKPGMIQLANQIDRDLTSLYQFVNNWVGTPGTNITTAAGLFKAPERLDLGAVPQGDRAALLSPTDNWGLAGGATAVYMQDVAKEAYRQGRIGMIGGIDTNMSQNVQSHTRGSANTTGLTTVGSQSTTYAASLNSNTMSLEIGGAAATTTINAGDVFTIAGVQAVNPVTKATLPHLQQFVVTATKSGSAITTTTTLTITPPIITTGAFQTVSAAPAASASLIVVGAASTSYASNLVFHKNAFALVMVPMPKPPGAVDVSRQSYKGYSVRVIPYFDGVSDISNWRLDVLYGVKCLDPRLATRLSGT